VQDASNVELRRRYAMLPIEAYIIPRSAITLAHLARNNTVAALVRSRNALAEIQDKL
jgi:hypothetical protein